MRIRSTNARNCEPRISLKVSGRPIRSESPPQKNLPTPLNSELVAIRVAPYRARASFPSPGLASPQIS